MYVCSCNVFTAAGVKAATGLATRLPTCAAASAAGPAAAALCLAFAAAMGLATRVRFLAGARFRSVFVALLGPCGCRGAERESRERACA